MSRDNRAVVGELVSQLSSGFGRPLADRSPSARRVALAPGPGPGLPTPEGGHGQLELPEITAIAAGLAAVEALWRPHVHHDPLSRTSVRLIATPAYEVWVLGWCRDQRVELHDHGGANAAFVVVEGELDELTLEGGELSTRHLGAGDLATVAAGVVHDVVNRHRAPATSIHVYADPLRSMTFYDEGGAPTFTELVQEVPALVASGDAGRALHPAYRT